MHSWLYSYITGPGPDGKIVFSVIAKRTYALGAKGLAIAADQPPIVEEEQYADAQNPFYSDVVAERELVAYKPSTDVVVAGSVCAPAGRQAYHIDAEVQAGPFRKTVRAFGGRKIEYKALRGLTISDPEPFTAVELGYCRAYGGAARSKNGALFTYPPNPIGKGFALKGGFEDAEGLPVPQLEDPASPVTADTLVIDKYESWPSGPKPASLGWTRRNFYPRYTYAGVLPEFLEAGAQKEAAGGVPGLRMDSRFFQGASDGLWGSRLRSGEPVTLKYLDPSNPVIQFQLPSEKPVMTVDLGAGRGVLAPELDTMVIDMAGKLVSLVWRGSAAMPDAFTKLELSVE